MLSSFIVLLASCFADVDPKPDMHVHAEFLKPGAAVQIRHDYKGQTALNSYETISIDVTHIYQNGILDITVLPSQNLDILSPLKTQSVPITARRVLSIPVQIGEGKRQKGSQNISQSQTKSSDIIALKAKETVY